MKLARSFLDDATDEISDQSGDFGGMGFQCEVAGIQEMDLGIGEIAAVGLGTGRVEERVVASPGRQERRLMGSEVGLPSGVQGDIGLILAEQIKLDVRVAGAVEDGLVVGRRVGVDEARVGNAVGVDGTRGVGLEEDAQAPPGWRAWGCANRP